MPELDKSAAVVAPGFLVRNIEELVALAQWPNPSLARVDLIEPGDMSELDNIRQMSDIVRSATVDASIYRSGT